MLPMARVEIEVAEETLAMWRMDAVFCGLGLAEWIVRRVGSVERVRRTPSEVAALLGRRHAAPEARDDDEIPDEGEALPVAPKVQKVVKPPRVQSTRGRIRDLAGQVFGRLTAVEIAGRSRGGSVMWRCVCVCGTEKVVASADLVCGMSKSCGCGRRGPRRPRPSA
jgi:hypothetical protein